MSEKITLVECPRDAMQGLHDFIPTAQKIEYIKLLLKGEFDELKTWALYLIMRN
jgi:hydroxymethylglutaryl-CoA lyase